jgi:hypothetical protein
VLGGGRVPVPGEKLGQAAGGVAGDSLQHVGKPNLGSTLLKLALAISVYMATARSPPGSERAKSSSCADGNAAQRALGAMPVAFATAVMPPSPRQTPRPPRPNDGRARREMALRWKTASGWGRH